MNIRALSAKLISDVIDQGYSLNERLPFYKNKCKKEADQRLLQAIVFGTLRFYPRYEYIAAKFLKTPFKAKDKILLYLICIGFFQLQELRVPEHAALSETVEAARVLKKPWGVAVVNAVLREFQRQSQNLEKIYLESEPARTLHPVWLIQKIKENWPGHFEQIMEANNGFPPLSLRVNRQKISREAYLNLLQENGIKANIIPGTAMGISLEQPQDVNTLIGFNEGLCSVQDGGAQFSAELLELSPGLKILDACAAPGGKTTDILETEPSVELTALDISEERVNKIKQNLSRLQLSAKILVEDAMATAKWWDKIPFDRIVLDPPCSATGVIRRHPDIKYLRQSQDIPALAFKQLALLKGLWPLLKPNGILLYITCSIFKEENQMIIQEFLSCQTDASVQDFSKPEGYPVQLGIQILPRQNSMDGFYYAVLRKHG